MEENHNKNYLFNPSNVNNTEEIISKSELTRESVMGKRAVPKPPKDFFEKVLDLELKLKRRFDIKVVQQLVKYYTVRNLIYNLSRQLSNIMKALMIPITNNFRTI